jgi:hypothetical protein
MIERLREAYKTGMDKVNDKSLELFVKGSSLGIAPIEIEMEYSPEQSYLDTPLDLSGPIIFGTLATLLLPLCYISHRIYRETNNKDFKYTRNGIGLTSLATMGLAIYLS